MAHVHNFATQDFPTTVSRGVELLAESWEPESVCLLDIPMLATRERPRYFRARNLGVRGFGIMAVPVLWRYGSTMMSYRLQDSLCI